MGAQVIAGTSSQEKLQFAKKACPAFLINYSDGDLRYLELYISLCPPTWG